MYYVSCSVNYAEKSFMKLATGVDVIKHSLPTTIWINQLKYLPLTSFGNRASATLSVEQVPHLAGQLLPYPQVFVKVGK
jgi:hypothetical protein